MNTELLDPGTHIKFNNGVNTGWGWIRGIAANELPAIGWTYIVEVDRGRSNIPEDYLYSHITVFGCHIVGMD